MDNDFAVHKDKNCISILGNLFHVSLILLIYNFFYISYEKENIHK